jgi:integrase/recombinase XerD
MSTLWAMPDDNYDQALKKFQKYLITNRYRSSTIDGYVDRVGRYLKFAKTDRPNHLHAEQFQTALTHRNRSTVNNYAISIMAYHRSIGDYYLQIPLLRMADAIPYYFDENDVNKIFSVIKNFKHYAMLQTLFYGCLRASELCNLDVVDVDLDNLILKVNDAKGGKSFRVMINDECGRTLRKYLDVRSTFDIDGRQPLFFTDRGSRWTRGYLYTMFLGYKDKAHITKKGGLHVFARHTTATLMIKNGGDIRVVQEILRHADIRTTLRYAHVSDTTKREKYNKFLTL